MYNNIYDMLVRKTVPFVDGGRDVQTGFDCWGLVMYVFSLHGIILEDYKINCMAYEDIDAQIAKKRCTWERITVPVEPCLIVMKFAHPVLNNHTGVYIGNGHFIHTRRPIGVNIDRIHSPAWERKIEGYYVPKGAVICN